MPSINRFSGTARPRAPAIAAKTRTVALMALAILAQAIILASCDRPIARSLSSIESSSVKRASYRSDFYSTVNRDWLLANPLPPKGYNLFNSFTSAERDNDDRLIAILDALDPESVGEDSPARNVMALYRCFLDLERRDRDGVTPIRKYLERFESAATIKELMNADLLCYRETGISCLLRFETRQNDAGVPALIHSGPTPTGLDVYRGGKNRRAYIRFLAELFSFAGYDVKEAKARARKVFDFERKLNAYALSKDKAIDPANTIWYPFYLFRTLYPNVDFRNHFESMGFAVPEGILISNQRLMEEAAKYFSDGGREALALYAERTLLDAMGPTLSRDFTRAGARLRGSLFGHDEGVDSDGYWNRQALYAVKFALPSQLGEIFVESLVPPGTREEASSIAERVVAKYPSFIERAEWMDARTKERALAKLKAIRKWVAYPDGFNQDYAGVALQGPAEGGTLFGNATMLRLRYAKITGERLGKPVDRGEWPIGIPVYCANAFYVGNVNAIFLPAGILRPPFYDPGKSSSWNMGAIGAVVGHEISHAFDTNGAKIDENGAGRVWWVKGDYERFASRCDRVRAYYDQAKGAYGARNDGTLTLSENVSDIMGLQCALEALKGEADPDYRDFFAAYATCMRSATTPETERFLSRTNEHSLARARVNRAVANFGEFQDTFGIKEGDPMYVAPGDRVNVW